MPCHHSPLRVHAASQMGREVEVGELHFLRMSIFNQLDLWKGRERNLHYGIQERQCSQKIGFDGFASFHWQGFVKFISEMLLILWIADKIVDDIGKYRRRGI